MATAPHVADRRRKRRGRGGVNKAEQGGEGGRGGGWGKRKEVEYRGKKGKGAVEQRGEEQREQIVRRKGEMRAYTKKKKSTYSDSRWALKFCFPSNKFKFIHLFLWEVEVDPSCAARTWSSIQELQGIQFSLSNKENSLHCHFRVFFSNEYFLALKIFSIVLVQNSGWFISRFVPSCFPSPIPETSFRCETIGAKPFFFFNVNIQSFLAEKQTNLWLRACWDLFERGAFFSDQWAKMSVYFDGVWWLWGEWYKGSFTLNRKDPTLWKK